MSRVDCFHSLKERERERERENIISFCLGLSFLRRQKPKKAKNGRTAVALVASSAVTSTPSITILSLDIDIARADATARSTRPPESHDARTVFAEFRPSFSVGRLRVNTVRKAFSFLFSALFFEIEKWLILIQSALMMTMRSRASHPPFFLVDATDATDARLEKSTNSFHARAKRGWSEGKKEKEKRSVPLFCARV